MTTYGVDASHWKWSDGIDFAAMKRSGRCDYLFAKATEGLDYADPSYGGWRSGAKGVGMLFGSFHFARPGDPVAQADYYLSAAQPVAGELVCLDLEDTAIPDAGNFGAAFCQRVKAETGAWPLLYTYPAFLATRDLSPIQRLGVPLWFADYTDPINSIKPWDSYVIRQFTSTGSLPGLPAKNVDLNSSPLTIDQLRALAVGAAPQEDDMPLTAADEAAIEKWGSLYEAAAQRVRQILIDGSKGWSLTHLQQITEGTDSRVVALGQAVAKLGDTKSLAAEIVAALPPGGTDVSEADLETALRKVFQSIPDATS